MNFSGYCFHMNTSIEGDFQICISVPLTLNTFHTFFLCLYCWHRTDKCLLGNCQNQCRLLINLCMQSEVEKYRYDQVYTFICFRVRLLLISGSEKIVFKCFSKRLKDIYYVKSGPVWSVFGPFFPAFSVNTSVFSPNTGK